MTLGIIVLCGQQDERKNSVLSGYCLQYQGAVSNRFWWKSIWGSRMDVLAHLNQGLGLEWVCSLSLRNPGKWRTGCVSQPGVLECGCVGCVLCNFKRCHLCGLCYKRCPLELWNIQQAWPSMRVLIGWYFLPQINANAVTHSALEQVLLSDFQY